MSPCTNDHENSLKRTKKYLKTMQKLIFLLMGIHDKKEKSQNKETIIKIISIIFNFKSVKNSTLLY